MAAIIDKNSAVGFGIDIGGSHISCVAIGCDGRILKKNTVKVSDRNPSAITRLLAECCKPVLEGYKVHCIGIGVPGNVDPIAGTTRYLPNFGWLEPIPLGSLLKEQLGLPDAKIRMRNDGRCAALAESRFGAGRGAKSFSMLTLGTGIGGALIIDGRLFDGCSFDAGDFGHHVIRSGREAIDCVCGKSGCFEAHCSADGMLRMYGLNGGCALGCEDVIFTYKIGDEIGVRTFDRYIDDLSTGLANLVTFYNPDVIALGGGLGQADELYEHIQELVDRKTLPATRGKVRIVKSMVGPDAGAIGAALLSLEDAEGEY